MLLKIGHRFLILNVLPRESDVLTLRIVQDLKQALSFTEQELKDRFIRQEGDVFQWGDPKLNGADIDIVDQPVDIPIGERAFDVIKEALQLFNSQKKLQVEFLPLYEHFVEGEEWALDAIVSEPSTEPTPIKEPEPRTTKEALGSRPLAEGSKD